MAVAPIAFDSVCPLLFADVGASELAFCCAAVSGDKCELSAPDADVIAAISAKGWMNPPCWFCPSHADYVDVRPELVWSLPPTRFVCRHLR